MDIICPRCKTSKYRNPAVRFMVNVCGHSLCTNCVELQFNRGSGKCEVCKIALKKSNFRPQMFLSAEVEKGVFIRKRILKDLTKTQKDFKTLKEYNDYLEEVESIVFNLSHGIDVDEMNAKVEKYKIENEDAVKKIKMLNSSTGVSVQEDRGEDEEDVSVVHDIVGKEVMVESDATDTKSSPAAAVVTGGVYQYKDFHIDNEGPAPPKQHLLDQLGYLAGLARTSTDAELAGGFSLEIACYKSLCSAMTGLYVLDSLRLCVILQSMYCNYNS